MPAPVDTGVVACFGEVLLRLTASGGATLRDTACMDVHVGGAEANVAVALANLGLPSRMISAVPENALGTLAIKSLRREGVETGHLVRGEGRMGMYFLTPSAGPRSGEVVYDRAASFFASHGEYDPAALDWARHLHISGISLALSAEASEAVRKLAGAGRERGMTISFDGNFRPSLWAASGREPRSEIAEIVALADLVFGNHKDVSLLLGREFSGDGGARRREAALALLDAFPNISAVASTARHVDDGTGHRITARIDSRGAAAETAERVLTNVVDRIGTGDAFAAGVLASWLAAPDDLQAAVEGGMALSALKHYEPGDFCRASQEEWHTAIRGAQDVAR